MHQEFRLFTHERCILRGRVARCMLTVANWEGELILGLFQRCSGVERE